MHKTYQNVSNYEFIRSSAHKIIFLIPLDISINKNQVFGNRFVDNLTWPGNSLRHGRSGIRTSNILPIHCPYMIKHLRIMVMVLVQKIGYKWHHNINIIMILTAFSYDDKMYHLNPRDNEWIQSVDPYPTFSLITPVGTIQNEPYLGRIQIPSWFNF